jgi:hypothetical protein
MRTSKEKNIIVKKKTKKEKVITEILATYNRELKMFSMFGNFHLIEDLLSQLPTNTLIEALQKHKEVFSYNN